MIWKDPNGQVHRVNTIRVVPKETGVRPTAPDQIHSVLGWMEPESGYEYVDADSGESKILAVDKTVLDKLFPKSDKIKVECFLPQEQISFADMMGDHYYLTPRVDSKTKTSNPTDVQGYALLLWVLRERKQVILVKFISGSREKVGIIYVRGNMLMLSTIIHSTYQRAEPPNVGIDLVRQVTIDRPEMLADKLVKKLGAGKLDPTKTEDIYENQLRHYIEELKTAGGKPVKTKLVPQIPAAANIFDLISNM